MRRGFTIIELLIVVAVIGVMATVVSLQLRGSDGNNRLEQAAESLAADLRLVVQYAQAGRVEDGVVPAAYGIQFSTTATPADYIVFADLDDDGVYNASTDATLSRETYVSDTVLQQIQLDTCSPNTGPICTLLVTIPDADITVNGSVTNLQVTLSHSESGNTASIFLYANTGRVEIQ